MAKPQDIDEILAERPMDLLMDILWDDPAVVAKIRNNLNNISADNIKYYHKHFCGESKGKQ